MKKFAIGYIAIICSICLLVVKAESNAVAVNPTPAITHMNINKARRDREEANNKTYYNKSTEKEPVYQEPKTIEVYDKRIGTKKIKRNKVKTIKTKAKITIYMPQENKIIKYYLSDRKDYTEEISYISIKINGKEIKYTGFSYVTEDL